MSHEPIEHLPDEPCPVCGTMVPYAQGFYDRKPIFRCPSCSYVIKHRSMPKTIAFSVLLLIFITIVVAVAGMVATGGL
jgi:hypothetical protein